WPGLAADADHRAPEMARALVQRDQLLRGRVPRLLGAEPILDQSRQLFSRRARPHRPAQVDLALVQQAPAEVPIRRQSRPVAGGAERLGHAGDDPDAPAERAAVPLPDAIDARSLRQADLLQLQLVLEPCPDGLRR